MKLIQQANGGENRVALLDNSDRLMAVYIQRSSMLNLGERIGGIITQKHPLLNGYFIQTDKQLSAFVPSRESYTQGQHVTIEITKEARRGKDANGIFTNLHATPAPDIAATLSAQFNLPVSDEWDDYNLDADVLELLEPTVTFEGGAALTIERTSVCWTIDVDSGKATLPLEKLNQIAISECVRHIKLRNLSGVILIDFAGAKRTKEVNSLKMLLAKELADDSRSSVLGSTVTGLIEIRRSRTSAALADVMTTDSGQLNTWTVGYQILRAVKKYRGGIPTVVAHPTVLTLVQESLNRTTKCAPCLTCPIDFFEVKESK